MREVPDDGRCAERVRIARIRRNGVAVDGIGRVFAAAVHADLPQALVVLAKPKGLEVSTAWVYQHYNRGRVVHSPCIWQLQDRLAEGAPALVPYMGNVLETVTIPAHPIIASIKAAMLSAGAYYALMSGSGPTVFAFARDEQTAEQIVAALADFEVETAITTTVGRIY